MKIKELFWKLAERIDSTADVHNKKGWSARKLTAFTMTALMVIVVTVWLIWALKNNNFNLMLEVLAVLASYGGACLGMATYQSIKTNKPANEPKV